ncbi:hypothetical protein ACFFRR_001240 [Megaselia abdita]
MKKSPDAIGYKTVMLGATGVGKTSLTFQFTTSDYICAYDLSLDDDYGTKTVSILVDGIETDLEIIDHPACEMSTEAFCSTYNVDCFCVVYSAIDKTSFKAAEKVLNYLKDNEMLLTRGAILVGNKTDLERHREITRQAGRKLAKEIGCKFIETSSCLDHNVDELLVGIVAQAKLNPQRIKKLSEKDKHRLSLQNTIQSRRRVDAPQKRIVKQMSICLDTAEAFPKPLTKSSGGNKKKVLNLESILRMGESEVEDTDSDDAMSNYRRGMADGASAIETKENRGCIVNKGDVYSSGTNSVNEKSKKPSSSKLANRTKTFITSVLKFKKALNVKRRSSSNCSDLFAI